MTASYPVGPGEAFLTEELQALLAEGCRIGVVPLWPRGRDGAAVSAGAAAGLEFIHRPLCDAAILWAAGVEFLSRPLRVARWLARLACAGPRRVRAKNLAVLPKALWLARVLRAHRADHLHCHWAATTATCAMVAADLAAVPWSMTCHRWDIYEDNLLAGKSRRAGFVRFISERGRADALRLGVPAARAVVVHLGVRRPPPAAAVTRAGGAFRLLCAANLIPVKGHRYLLEAMALLRAQGVDVRLSLAGDGDLRAPLQAQARDAGVDGQVEFLGHVAHDRLLDLYREGLVDAFVLPSIDLGDGEHEGIPVSLMEAMAHGVPVLSTRTGSIEELLPADLGATVPERDPAAIARLVARLASDADYRADYRQRQADVIELWGSDRGAKRLLELIRRAGTRDPGDLRA